MKIDFNKMWSSASDIDYEPAKTIEVLTAFNQVISGLYFLSGEEKYIENILNSSTYEIDEYQRLIGTIGELSKVADTMEMARNILFGGCVDWNYILSQFIRRNSLMEVTNEQINPAIKS